MSMFHEEYSPIRAYVGLAAVLGSMIGAMILFLRMGDRLTERQVPLLKGVTTVTLELGEAEAWLEDVRLADRPESIHQVWRHLNEAAWYTEAMLQGGERNGELFPPASKPALREMLGELRDGIVAFREDIGRLLEARDTLENVEEADLRHDAMFRKLVVLAADASEVVHLDIAGRALVRRRLLIFMVVGSILLCILLGMAFYRHESGRRRAERALLQEKAYSDSLVDSLPGVFYLLDENGRAVRWNHGFERMTGYTSDEMATRGPWDYFDGLEREYIARQFKTVVEKGKVTVTADLVTKDGRAIPHCFTGARIEREGKVLVVGMGIDISEQKRAEEELRAVQDELLARRTREKELVEAELEEARAELVRKTRLATLGQLTATVSHEIRNPLGSIRTAVYSIAQEVGGRGPLVDRALERAERNVLRCDRIIEELLDYTRVGESRPSPTNLDQWLGEVLDEYAWPDGIEVERRFEANAEISVDRDQLRRCVVNLVTNACQAMSGNEPGKAWLFVETAVEGDRLLVRIRDTGSGIAPADMDRLFEPFFTTKGFGVGLGLPMVEQLTRQLGGSVTIESELGRGATAVMSLPLSRNKEPY